MRFIRKAKGLNNVCRKKKLKLCINTFSFLVNGISLHIKEKKKEKKRRNTT